MVSSETVINVATKTPFAYIPNGKTLKAFCRVECFMEVEFEGLDQGFQRNTALSQCEVVAESPRQSVGVL